MRTACPLCIFLQFENYVEALKTVVVVVFVTNHDCTPLCQMSIISILVISGCLLPQIKGSSGPYLSCVHLYKTNAILLPPSCPGRAKAV